MIRNTAGQIAAGQVINAATGGAFAGAVTVYVTIDGGVQAPGSVGAGACAAEGNGLYTYTPTAAETNGASISFTFTGAGAVPSTTTYDTLTPAQSQAVQTATGPSVRYVSAVIANALIGLNIFGSGQPIPPADGQVALFWLNLILDDWNADPRASYAEPFTVFAASGANPETIGPSGSFVLPARPPTIEGVALIQGGSLTTIPVTRDPDWWAVQRLITGPPSGAYYEASEPNGQLFVNGAIAAGTPVRLQLRYTFGRVALPDALVLPPGYESALTLTLMEAIAEPFHATVSPLVTRRAGVARALIFANNLRIPRLTARGQGAPGFAHAPRWDYRTGTMK